MSRYGATPFPIALNLVVLQKPKRDTSRRSAPATLTRRRQVGMAGARWRPASRAQWSLIADLLFGLSTQTLVNILFLTPSGSPQLEFAMNCAGERS
jgi:hypothetical protein